MAFISRLTDMKSMFDTPIMMPIYDYLSKACDPLSDVYKRILATQQESKIELDSGVFAIEQSYSLKSSAYAFYETHKKYVDFQLVVKGAEFFSIASASECAISKPYDEARDLIVYDAPKTSSMLYLQSGTLAVFFPQDVHSGGLGVEQLGDIRVHKSVLKVPFSLLSPKWV